MSDAFDRREERYGDEGPHSYAKALADISGKPTKCECYAYIEFCDPPNQSHEQAMIERCDWCKANDTIVAEHEDYVVQRDAEQAKQQEEFVADYAKLLAKVKKLEEGKARYDGGTRYLRAQYDSIVAMKDISDAEVERLNEAVRDWIRQLNLAHSDVERQRVELEYLPLAEAVCDELENVSFHQSHSKYQKLSRLRKAWRERRTEPADEDFQSILHEYISDRLDASERVCKHVAMAHGKNHEILACVTCFLLKKWQEKVRKHGRSSE